MFKAGLVAQRENCLETPQASLPLIQKLPGMESYNPETDVLKVLKGGYGLKDAPRVWRLRLGQ